MSCCGVDNYLDFKLSERFKENSTQEVPAACCVLEGDIKKFTPKFPNCTQNPSAANSYYMTVSTYGYNCNSIVHSSFFF